MPDNEVARGQGTLASADIERDDPAYEYDVSVLVVAFQSEECIERCIEAIGAAAQRVTYEIRLIDNGDGGSEALISSRFPEVTIVQSEGNVGFARANNLLARHATGRHLLLINPDAFLQEGAIDALLDASRRYPEAGALGGVTVDENGNPDFGNAIPEPNLADLWQRLLGRAKVGKSLPPTISTDSLADVLSGGFMMVPTTIWLELGGLDERFFLYCEEVDLCVRIRKSERKLFRIARAKAVHQIAHGNFQCPMRRLYQAAGTVEFLRKHWPLRRRLLGLVLIWLGAIARTAIGTIVGKPGSDLEAAAVGNRLVALRPRLWIHGYDRAKGLKAQIDRGALQE